MAVEDLRVNDQLTISEHELVWRFGPSGGPGGQHANTSNTRAEVVFEIVGSPSLSAAQQDLLFSAYGPRLRVVADDTRSQIRNREQARRRMAEKLAAPLRPKRKRKATKPSKGAKERRLRAKKERSQTKAGRGRVRNHE